MKKSERELSHLLNLCKAKKKPLLVLLQMLTSAINRMITIPEARQILTESLAFEKANLQFKKERVISTHRLMDLRYSRCQRS